MNLPHFIQRATSSRPFMRQWLGWLALLLVFGGLLGFMQWREHKAIAQDEQIHLQTQVRVAERVLTAQIQSVDAALRTMMASLDRWRGADGYLPFAHEHLKRVEAMMPGAEAFMVLDENGKCQLSSSPELMGLDFSSNAFYLDARGRAATKMLNVAPPYRSVLGVWSVTISRAVVSPDGKFQGVVAAMLSPEYFQSLMSRLRYSEDMRVALIHSGGLLYVASPPGDEMRALDFSEGDNYFSRHHKLGQAQSYHQGTTMGGEVRSAMLQTVTLPDAPADYHFVAIASRDTRAMYGQWQRDSITHSLFLLFAALLTGMALARHQKSAQALRQMADASEQAMRRSNQRFEQVANTIPSVLFDFDLGPDGNARLIYVSPYSQQLLGSSPEQLMADPLRLLRHVHSGDADSIRSTLLDAVQKSAPFDCEFRYTPIDASERWIHMSATPGGASTTEAAPHWSGYLVDITDAKTHQQTLQIMAYQDPLTGAANRRSMMDALHTELARVHRTHAAASVIMLDVDFFKRINDNYGHDAGDEVLKHLVAVLQKGLRSIDTLGRLGGEEFAILLPETPLEAAVSLAERLRLLVEQNPAQLGDQSLSFTVSLGVAALNMEVAHFNEAIKRADEAMYQAKQAGRNRVCCA